LREESEPVGHKLGLAWAEACRALMAWLGGDSGRGAKLMLSAVQSLEAIPIVPDAARLRRQLAGRLADIGDRAAAVSQLRQVHNVFVRLGAELELDKTRGQFRELGVKPPAREESQGAEGLTGRELDVARLVARRKSNKAIGNALHISPRTVGTHLSNVFRKLEVNSRAELTDYLRTHGLTDD
jgi:DNA-binding CsgD family transcriptional regulator